MVSTPHGKDLNEENGTSSKKTWRVHQVQKREFIKESDQARREENPSKGDKILRKHQTMRKKKREKVIKLEKAPTKRKKNKKRWECKNFHQVERNNDPFKRHMRHEIP